MKKNVLIMLLVVGVASLIFVLSSMSYEQQSIVPLLDKYLPKEWMESNLSWIELSYAGNIVSIDTYGASHFVEFIVRKMAHLTIFGCLATVLFLFIIKWLSVVYAFGIAFALTVGYAAMDEIHQNFTEGRTPMWQDVMIDSVGALIGLSVVSFICAIRTRHVSQNESRNKFQKEIIET